MTAFGRRLRRVEDARLLRGLGRYVDDVPAGDALHVEFVRSPYAHARVGAIDAAAARAVDGVTAVFTARDLGEYDRPLPLLFPHPDLTEPRTQHPMTATEANYAGQIVAMIVAEDRYAAEDAREHLVIDWEPLPVVVDLEQAAAPDSPRVHEEMRDNVSGRIRQQVGDIDAAFAQADVVIRRRYVLERSAAMPMETRGMLAVFDERAQQLTLYDATQAAHPLRAGLAAWFGLPESSVRVVAGETGGGFGVKGFFFYPEEVLVPWAAMRLRRRVKWIEDRIEHFTASHHERTQIHDVELAATAEGVVLGLRDRFLLDTGAHVPYGLELGRITASQAGGPYRIPNIDIEFAGVYTNTVTCTPYRGAGRPYTCFTIERALDELARELGLDQFEIRRRNIIGHDEFPYRRDGLVTADGFTVIVDSGAYERLLDTIEAALDLPAIRARQQAARGTSTAYGVGMAMYVESTGGGPYEGARVTVEPDTGLVRVATGFPSQGQSHETTLAQVAAEVLGVDVESIRVSGGDTQAFGAGIATYASRGAVLGGNAVSRAASAVREKAVRLASHMLEVAPADLELVDGDVRVKGSPGSRLSLREVAKATRPDRYGFDPDQAILRALPPALPRPVEDEGPLLPGDEAPGLSADAYFSAQNATWASGAHAAVVAIDLETGMVRIERYVAIHDCGKVINPLVIDGQVVGGIAQGIGGAFYERLAYDANGQIQNASLMDFLMPYATEVPPIELHHVETPSPLNPLGIKGAGEAGAIPVPAACAAAVENALSEFGVSVRRMPLSPQDIVELLERAGTERKEPPER